MSRSKSQNRHGVRRDARQLTLQYLLALEVQRGHNLDLLDGFLSEFGQSHESCSLAKQWIRGAWQDVDRIDQLIQDASQNWDVRRISQTDRANLRVGVYQMLHCSDIPLKVVINEAVELAKIFSTTQAGGFINGVLDAIKRRLQSETSHCLSEPADGSAG